jgi:hypothetical protein
MPTQKYSDFPEFYRRFEKAVDTRSANKDFNKLIIMMQQYSPTFYPTRKQVNALAGEAYRRGFKNITTGEIDTYEVKTSRTGRKYRRRVNISGYHGLRARTVTQRKARTLSRKQVKVLIIHNYVKRGYSANKISRELKRQGRGMRRKELLKIVREAKHQQLKVDASKHTRKKYRKK